MGRRGFGFVHHSRTLFCRAVPNLSITIRNFFIAVGRTARGHWRGHCELDGQLRRQPPGARRAARGGAAAARERREWDRGGHVHRHPAAQLTRGATRADESPSP
jgi:hypothetical protein